MATPHISVLLTDLDNTLYDWVTYFSCAFYDMVAVAARTLEVPEETLLDQLRSVHQRLHSSEHPYAILETDAVRNHLGNLSRTEQASALDEAFHAFNRTRINTLKLYEGVDTALGHIREKGTIIVGHTEATVPNALFRLRKLGIEALFDHLYASTPQGLEPPVTTIESIVKSTPVAVHYLPPGERKPNPIVLEDICQSLHVAPSVALYVGDSISRDIGMAKAAGLWAAWAKYGTAYEPSHWDRLVRITHWTEEDVRRSRLASDQYGNAQPDVTLLKSFAELLEHFTFVDSK